MAITDVSSIFEDILDFSPELKTTGFSLDFGKGITYGEKEVGGIDILSDLSTIINSNKTDSKVKIPEVDINLDTTEEEVSDGDMKEEDDSNSSDSLSFDLPELSVDIPSLDISVDVPEVDIPEVDVPEVDIPEVDVPSIEFPEVDLGVDIDVPDIELPEFDIDIPDVEITAPDLKEVLPDVDFTDIVAPVTEFVEGVETGITSSETEQQTTEGESLSFSAGETTGEVLKDVGEAVVDIAEPVLETTEQIASETYNIVKDTVTPVADVIASVSEPVANAIYSTVEKTAEYLGEAAELITDNATIGVGSGDELGQIGIGESPDGQTIYLDVTKPLENIYQSVTENTLLEGTAISEILSVTNNPIKAGADIAGEVISNNFNLGDTASGTISNAIFAFSDGKLTGQEVGKIAIDTVVSSIPVIGQIYSIGKFISGVIGSFESSKDKAYKESIKSAGRQATHVANLLQNIDSESSSSYKESLVSSLNNLVEKKYEMEQKYGDITLDEKYQSKLKLAYDLGQKYKEAYENTLHYTKNLSKEANKAKGKIAKDARKAWLDALHDPYLEEYKQYTEAVYSYMGSFYNSRLGKGIQLGAGLTIDTRTGEVSYSDSKFSGIYSGLEDYRQTLLDNAYNTYVSTYDAASVLKEEETQQKTEEELRKEEILNKIRKQMSENGTGTGVYIV